MTAFIKANDWVQNKNNVADIDSDQFAVALSNTAPTSETNNPLTDTNGILANVTQISYTNLSSRLLTKAAAPTQVGGTYKLDFDDLVLLATGGSVGPFRYIWIYDDSTTSPADALVGYFDLVTPVTLSDGSSRTLKFHTNGFFNET